MPLVCPQLWSTPKYDTRSSRSMPVSSLASMVIPCRPDPTAYSTTARKTRSASRVSSSMRSSLFLENACVMLGITGSGTGFAGSGTCLRPAPNRNVCAWRLSCCCSRAIRGWHLAQRREPTNGAGSGRAASVVPKSPASESSSSARSCRSSWSAGPAHEPRRLAINRRRRRSRAIRASRSIRGSRSCTASGV